MAVIGPTLSNLTEPPEPPEPHICGTCAFCRDQGTSYSCFWQIVAAALDGTDVDDAEVPLVEPDYEGCRHWRRSKWA